MQFTLKCPTHGYYAAEDDLATECTMCLKSKLADTVGVTADAVNKPEHYSNGDIECRDAMIAAFGEEDYEVFCRLNAFKYLWRCKYKGTQEQDLRKATWYLRSAVGEDPRAD